VNGLREGIGGLHPSYFALVMATGIVSIAADLTGMKGVAAALFWLNLVFYAALAVLYLARLGLATGRFVADLSDHNRGVGFLTTVAGTCVLGSQFFLIRGDGHTASLLWFLGIALWLVLTYTIFTCLTVKARKPTLEDGLNGGWLLTVVSIQSVSVLGNLLAPEHLSHRDEVLFFTLALWLAGGMLYIWIIALIFYRYTFFTLSPAHLSPPYWINMGAMAISTLAGAGLIANAPHSTLLRDLLPFLKGFTLLFWSTATLWIPMLLILGVWRHVYRRFPLAYDPVCTHRLAGAVGQPFLLAIPRYFVYVALGAWLVTSLGLASSLIRQAASLIGRRGEPGAGEPSDVVPNGGGS
jgi:tellurite resistance protein TehA-like permease